MKTLNKHLLLMILFTILPGSAVAKIESNLLDRLLPDSIRLEETYEVTPRSRKFVRFTRVFDKQRYLQHCHDITVTMDDLRGKKLRNMKIQSLTLSQSRIYWDRREIDRREFNKRMSAIFTAVLDQVDFAQTKTLGDFFTLEPFLRIMNDIRSRAYLDAKFLALLNAQAQQLHDLADKAVSGFTQVCDRPGYYRLRTAAEYWTFGSKEFFKEIQGETGLNFSTEIQKESARIHSEISALIENGVEPICTLLNESR